MLTAVIVTQMSVGRSLKASDYLLGTIGGSIYGGAGAPDPAYSELALLCVLVIAVAPLALFAALRPDMNVVPISAIIVLLVPAITMRAALFGDLPRPRGGAGRLVGLVCPLVLPRAPIARPARPRRACST